MSKSIADYIDFSEDFGDFKKYSIKFLVGKDIIVKRWSLHKSAYDEKYNPDGNYARVEIEFNGEPCYCNVSSYPILLQLKEIEDAKKKNNEDDMSFTCTVRKYGASYKLMPIGWSDSK